MKVCNGSKMTIRNCDFYTNLAKSSDCDYLWIDNNYPNGQQNVINEDNNYYQTL